MKPNSEQEITKSNDLESEIAADTHAVETEHQESVEELANMETKTETYPGNRSKVHYYLKYISLVILTIQNAALGLSVSYASNNKKFSKPAAVLMAEIMKLLICLCLVTFESKSIQKAARSVYITVFINIKDTFRVSVPSFLYVIQNNLLYVSASNLDAATYQVTYQLKLLTTAFFAVIVLKRDLKRWQWLALTILAAGVALVQLSSAKNDTKVNENQSKILGFSAALGACFISGFAGIYFEKVLKESDISVWMRNVQLSLCSIPFGIITYLINDSITNFFVGFDGFIWYLVMLQAAGGLIVAVVVKYADNILKGFATSTAIILTCIVSIYWFDFHITYLFACGTVLVISSIFLYGYVPKKKETRNPVSQWLI